MESAGFLRLYVGKKWLPLFDDEKETNLEYECSVTILPMSFNFSLFLGADHLPVGEPFTFSDGSN
jgi:hypothetical protein